MKLIEQVKELYTYIYENYSHTECESYFGRRRETFGDKKFNGNIRLNPLTDVLNLMEKEIVCEVEGFTYGGSFHELLDGLKNDYEELLRHVLSQSVYQSTFNSLVSYGSMKSLIEPLEEIGFKFTIKDIEW